MKDKISEFLNYLKVEKNCSQKTIIDYESDIEQFATETNINNIEEITKYNIRAFLSKLTDEGAKPATRNRKLTSLRSFCKYLCAEGYLTTNPSIDVSYAKIEKRLPKTMTLDTTSKIIDSATNPRDKAALETLYGTGCRVDELINIKIDDIDFSNSMVRLIGKGNKERVVPISVNALVSIIDYIAARDVNSIYLFPSPLNQEKPISQKAMYNITTKYGKQNGVNSSPHKFRHSIATHLLANGMDIRKIQELLGHENINTTTIYTQVVIDQMAREFHSAHPRG